MHDLVLSIDVTGSMYTALASVRDSVVELVRELGAVLPGLRVGVIAHTDYDYDWVIQTLKLTDEPVESFVKGIVSPGYGKSSAECYELVLRDLRSMGWRASAKKTVVMIGDSTPHVVPDAYSRAYLGAGVELPRWENEARLLKQLGVTLTPVRVLDYGSEAFWNGLGKVFGTQTLEIDQLGSVVDAVGLVGFAVAGVAERYKPRSDGPDYRRTLAKLTGKPVSARSASIGSGYQVVNVPMDCAIREFVQSHGVTGDGFYEWTKAEIVQDYKKVLAVNKETGAIVTGSRARTVLGIGKATGRYAPRKDATHTGFIQSTSVNRKLVGGTNFAYRMACS